MALYSSTVPEIDNNHRLLPREVIGIAIEMAANLCRQTGFTILKVLAMGTIQTAAILPSAKPLPRPLPIVATLEAKIAATGVELDFYHQLLSWLLFSCDESKRHAIKTLRDEVAGLRSGGFSALVEGLGNLKNVIQHEMVHPDLFSDVAHLQLYFTHVEGVFQLLKTKIHLGFGDFTHVRIW